MRAIARARRVRVAELEGEEAAEAGFTLIELMVVLLIIAILLAIAIPTFLGVTGSANDRAAQSNLTNALTEAAAQYQSNGQTFSNIGATTLSSSAPEFSWAADGDCSTGPQNCVSFQTVDVGTSGDYAGIVLAAYSKGTSTCWYAVNLNATPVISSDTNSFFTVKSGTTVGTTGGTFYAKHTVTGAGASAQCNAAYPISNPFTWSTTYANANTVTTN